MLGLALLLKGELILAHALYGIGWFVYSEEDK
jgi:hypothetical protein